MLKEIRNPVFRRYAEQYREIYDDFTRQVEQFGVPFAESREEEILALREELKALGVKERNNGASLYLHEVCGACDACRTGEGSYTGILSLMCHRNCFFCFNPNQEEYDALSAKKKDWQHELEQLHRQNPVMRYIALTGGEPLLHKEEMMDYFRTAKTLWPGASLRLYTSGDLLDAGTLEKLSKAGLEEIRFSLKLEDEPDRRETVFRAMEAAKAELPRVMVEMPVMPEAEQEMRHILERLENMEIYGINLLELCFPCHNADAFLERGYALRYPPYQTLYNFWYAGGLPVDGSEVTALKLLRYAAEQEFRLNVHYCSLENKHSGQVYQQNLGADRGDPTYEMSGKDFYLKTVRVFGKDAKEAERLLRARGRTDYRMEEDSLRCSPACAELLKKKNMELGISRNIREYRNGEAYIRELRIDPIAAGDYSRELL